MQGRIFDEIKVSNYTVLRIKKILENYQTIAQSNPHTLRSKIPSKEIWRFFVDGVMQSAGWEPYENREKGYLQAAGLAFDRIFQLEAELNSDFIKTIHFLATNQVSSTNYDESCPDQVGEYRSKHNDKIFFGLDGCLHGNASLEGLRETVRKQQFMQTAFFTIDIHVLERYILLDRQKLSYLRQGRDNDLRMYIQTLLYNEDVDLAVLPTSFQRKLYRVFEALAFTKTRDELARVLHQIARQAYGQFIQLSFCSAQDDKTHTSLNQAMSQLISNYSKKIQEVSDPIDKLVVIVTFIRTCMQKHPFVDGNGRTFCMMLLNHLLLKNNFPLSIPNDPNRYSMFSVKQMVIETVHGMDNVFKLLQKKSLYRVSTEGVIKDLKRSRDESAVSSLGALMAAEEQARERFAKKGRLS